MELLNMGGELSQMQSLNSSLKQQVERLRAKSSSTTSVTQGSIAELEQKCSHKDFLLKTLAELLKSSCDQRCSTMTRLLRESTYRPSYVRGLDFNLETLCQFIEGKPDAGLKSKGLDVFEKKVWFLALKIYPVDTAFSHYLLMIRSGDRFRLV